jgi:hypothetical protein
MYSLVATVQYVRTYGASHAEIMSHERFSKTCSKIRIGHACLLLLLWGAQAY